MLRYDTSNDSLIPYPHVPDDRAQGQEVQHPVQSSPDVSPPPPGAHDGAGVQQQLVGAALHPGVGELEPGHRAAGEVTLPVLEGGAVTSDDLQATLVVTEKILFGGQIPGNQSILMTFSGSSPWDV